MNQRIQKIKNAVKNDLSENGELYFMYGAGLVAGIVVSKVLFGKPKIVQAIKPSTVLNAWLLGIEETGSAVFILGPEQRKLWEEVWAAAIAAR